MKHTADLLRMGASANVLRAISALGLQQEHKEAKARGIAKAGGRRSRKPVNGTRIEIGIAVVLRESVVAP